ncbi:MAG: AEC family transporter [Candidatus Heteroscillospira sp.]|jgi:predicted permease
MSTTALVAKLTIYILAGYVTVKSGTVSKDFHKQFSSMIMLVPMPALIIRSFYNTELTAEAISQFGSTTVCTVVMLCALGVVGYFAKRLHKVPSEAHICVYGMMTSNFNFFGMPIVEALFGNEGIFYYTILTALARIVYYGFPPYLLGDGQKASLPEFMRQMICPPIVAIFVGLVIYLFQIPLPTAVEGVMDGLANTASPLGMMLCGMTLANANLRDVFTRPIMAVMCVLRLLIAPAVVLGACLLCGFPSLVSKLAVVYSMLPFGALLPTFATRYCSDEHSAIYGSVLVSMSTVLSIFSIPLWIYILGTVL